MYSRLRTDSVCARSTRADAAQLVSAMTTISGPSPFDLRSAMITMTSGRVGMTSTTLDTTLSASSGNPPAYPPPMPTTMEISVASRPAPMPMASEARVLTTSWVNTSWPICVVPSQ